MIPEFTYQRPQFKLPIPYQIRLGNELLEFRRPKLVGIINITPDSFYKESRSQDLDKVLQRIETCITDGADFIDIGGVSSRPGATYISEAEEIDRLLPVLGRVVSKFPKTLFSIDTFRNKVAKIALQNGVAIINDISGGKYDPEMLRTVGLAKAPIILMHSRGDFNSMHDKSTYKNITVKVATELQTQIMEARKAGISDILVDPGFGFSKNIAQNFDLFRNLGDLGILDCPILIGISRKSMVSKTIQKTAAEALNGTTALHMAALMQGVHILRVHDVKEAKETIQLFENLCSQES